MRPSGSWAFVAARITWPSDCMLTMTCSSFLVGVSSQVMMISSNRSMWKASLLTSGCIVAVRARRFGAP